MENINKSIAAWLQSIHIPKEDIGIGTKAAILISIVVIAYITTKIFKHLLIPMVHRITARTKAKWDDYLFNEQMMTEFSRLIPPLVWYVLIPMAFDDMPLLLSILQKACLIYIVVIVLRLIGAFLKSLYDISNEHEKLRNRPLKGIYQMVNLIAIGIGGIFILSILIDRDAGTILAGLGASAAVLMLIFKDSILGLVAGVQLSANDMLRPGDWITMGKYGANGYVVEVSLTTVKVQNFDKTITTIPPYALVSDSFQNWRGMRETGGRRIKRSLFIDVNTIHFCTPHERKLFIEKEWISPEAESPVNLQAYRNYICRYLKQHPRVCKDQMIMVRELQPASEGLPMEVYCFVDQVDWMPYEAVQSEIMDHVLAMAPHFGLRIYQRPAGTDFQHNYPMNT